MAIFFVLLSFKADIDIGQRSALSPILFALYITSFFHIFKKRTKNLPIPILVSLFFFVDDSLFISQEKSYKKSNVILYCSYTIISSLFNQFSLVIKHKKSKAFYFSRLTKNINPPLLNLRPAGGTILKIKDIWHYLGLFFDITLDFMLTKPFQLSRV